MKYILIGVGALIIISVIVFLNMNKNNYEILVSDQGVRKILDMIKDLNNKINFLEKRLDSDRAQFERTKTNLYDAIGINMESNKVSNVALTGLLNRHASLAAGPLPSAH